MRNETYRAERDRQNAAIRAEADPENKSVATNSVYWEDGAVNLQQNVRREEGYMYFTFDLCSGYRHLGGEKVVKTEVVSCRIPEGYQYLTRRHRSGKNNDVLVTFKKK